MAQAKAQGLPLVGIIFLLIGVLKFVRGDDGLVWIILGMLFGGLGIFGRKQKGTDES